MTQENKRIQFQQVITHKSIIWTVQVRTNVLNQAKNSIGQTDPFLYSSLKNIFI